MWKSGQDEKGKCGSDRVSVWLEPWPRSKEQFGLAETCQGNITVQGLPCSFEAGRTSYMESEKGSKPRAMAINLTKYLLASKLLADASQQAGVVAKEFKGLTA